MSYFGIHNHTCYSNLRLKDSINKVDVLIQTANDIGLEGIAITDHECLSSHIKAIKFIKEAKEKGKIDSNFKLALGNEIYLVDRNEVNAKRENNDRISFYHFILVAKNKTGYEAIKRLSSLAWENSFYYKGLERVPTYYDNFYEVMKNQKGNIIASTACLGSQFSECILQNNYEKAKLFINYMRNLFGEDFYIEIQPSHQQEQIEYNIKAIDFAKINDVKVIVSTDAHYPLQKHKKIHSIYLKSKDGDRETSEFYDSTSLLDKQELKTYFEYISEDVFEELLSNTLEIKNKIEDFELFREVQIPKSKMVVDTSYLSIYNKEVFKDYEYIQNYIQSNIKEDKELMALIAKGLIEKNIPLEKKYLERIDEELRALWKISEKLNQSMASYYVLTTHIIDLIWSVSLVGISRGSAGAFFICYLTNICQINPFEYSLPNWRHIHESRPDYPDKLYLCLAS